MRLTLPERLSRIDWAKTEAALWDRGCAVAGPLLGVRECAELTSLWDQPDRFRSRVDMARHRFGIGEYRYFAEPLPEPVAQLRRLAYPPLAAIANRWAAALAEPTRFPAALPAFLTECAAREQTRPTPLLLRYETDGYNCLHQDVYGPVAFPLQAVVVLSRSGLDYTGGELLFVEQRPRAQSAGEALLPARGELVIFTNRSRPVPGRRGYHRVAVRHGVSRIRSGRRFALGVIFHDAA